MTKPNPQHTVVIDPATGVVAPPIPSTRVIVTAEAPTPALVPECNYLLWVTTEERALGDDAATLTRPEVGGDVMTGGGPDRDGIDRTITRIMHWCETAAEEDRT